MTILYGLVARGPNVILSSHQDGAGNFEDVVRSMLPNIPTRTDAKTTYTSNNFMFHVMIENGLIFMCATDSDSGKKQPYAFLSQIKTEFLSGSLAGDAQFAGDGELNIEFKQTLATQMSRYSRPEETDKLTQMQSQVDDVKGIMTQNIEKVLERGERLEDLIQHTEDLEAHSNTFRKTARRVQRKMWWKNTKMTLCLIALAIIIITVLILIILFSTGVLPGDGGGGGDKPTTTMTPSPP